MSEFVSYIKTQTITTKADSADGQTNAVVNVDKTTQTSVQKTMIDGSVEVQGTITITSDNLLSTDTPIIQFNAPQSTWTESQFDEVTAFRGELATLADALKLHGGS